MHAIIHRIAETNEFTPRPDVSRSPAFLDRRRRRGARLTHATDARDMSRSFLAVNNRFIILERSQKLRRRQILFPAVKCK